MTTTETNIAALNALRCLLPAVQWYLENPHQEAATDWLCAALDMAEGVVDDADEELEQAAREINAQRLERLARDRGFFRSNLAVLARIDLLIAGGGDYEAGRDFLVRECQMSLWDLGGIGGTW